MKATSKDLRLHTPELLAAADRGESIVITYRGKRRAVLRRWEPETRDVSTQTHNPAFGIWADKTEDVHEQVRQLRQRRPLP